MKKIILSVALAVAALLAMPEKSEAAHNRGFSVNINRGVHHGGDRFFFRDGFYRGYGGYNASFFFRGYSGGYAGAAYGLGYAPLQYLLLPPTPPAYYYYPAPAAYSAPAQYYYLPPAAYPGAYPAAAPPY